MTKNQIRLILLFQSYPDGLTIAEISDHLGVDWRTAKKLVLDTFGFYVDRWRWKKSRYIAVYCLAEIPEDCPRP